MKFVRRPTEISTMSKDLTRIERSAPAKRETGSVTPGAPSDIQKFSSPFGFFSFRYSYREVTDFDGRLRLKAKDTRYENGKLELEEFEGVLDQGPSPYDLHLELQRRFQEQAISFMKSLFFPFSLFFRPHRKDEEDK
jgi:hypothetical protein